MTRAQANQHTEEINKAERLIMQAMEDLEWSGHLSPELEEAYNIIQNLPEYESNE